MKTGCWPNPRGTRVSALLLAALLLFVCPLSAGETAELPGKAELAESVESLTDVDLTLALDAVTAYVLTDEEGRLLLPRKGLEMIGRGIPGHADAEPDYRAVIGYIALQSGWGVSQFNTFTETPWMLPVYHRVGEKWQIAGFAQHKTPVLVIDQRMREGADHRYEGYLQVIRLDTRQQVWIDVAQFVTLPYWSMTLPEAVRYGYCVAVYEDVSGDTPIGRNGTQDPLPGGTRVLMCDISSARYASPDADHHPLLGIVFRDGEAGEGKDRVFLFFNPEDLTLIY